jgi:hypothetical protein
VLLTSSEEVEFIVGMGSGRVPLLEMGVSNLPELKSIQQRVEPSFPIEKVQDARTERHFFFFECRAQTKELVSIMTR